MEPFDTEVEHRLRSNNANTALRSHASAFMESSLRAQYSYNYFWCGRPVIQYPQDLIAMQEIVWRVQPDLIIETGVAHGGSLIFFASLLELNAICGGPPDAIALGIDVDIRPHNRVAIEAHPLSRRVRMMEGSSTDADVCRQVRAEASRRTRVMVCLDSHHTHDHVAAELEAYAPLVTTGSYCVVCDTIIEQTADCSPVERPWGRGNNPHTAVQRYLRDHPEWHIDHQMDDKLLISASPCGYLTKVR